jgi:endonuclease/exonuclease/phosphatase family metal-dependent hydrolase
MPDIILFQELIVHRDHLLKSFVHHPFATPEMKHKLFSSRLKIWPSGLCIASRYPIIEYKHYRFQTTKGYHLERLTSRGLIYARIRTPEHGDVHTIVTHLNAWKTPEACTARRHQAREINVFIRDLGLNLVTDTLVIGGDINIDLLKAVDETRLIERTIGHGCVFPVADDPSFANSRNPLVGNDDMAEYGCDVTCRNVYMSTGKCEVCPDQLLDSVAWLSGDTHVPTIVTRRVSSVRVIPVTTLLPYECEMSRGFTKRISTVSDHDPVVVEFNVPQQQQQTTTVVDDDTTRLLDTSEQDTFSIGWFSLLIALTIVFTVLIVVAFKK